MQTIFKTKSLGFGVGTFLLPSLKNNFRDGFISDNLVIVWIEIKTEGEKVLVGNMYVPPRNEEQLHTLDKFLESLKNETETQYWIKTLNKSQK